MRSHDEVDRLLYRRKESLTQRLATRTIWLTLLVHRWIDQSASDSVWEFSDHFPFERRVTGLGENSTNGSCLARMQASAQIELDRLESSSVRCRFHYTRPILCSVRREKRVFFSPQWQGFRFVLCGDPIQSDSNSMTFALTSFAPLIEQVLFIVHLRYCRAWYPWQ